MNLVCTKQSEHRTVTVSSFNTASSEYLGEEQALSSLDGTTQSLHLHSTATALSVNTASGSAGVIKIFVVQTNHRTGQSHNSHRTATASIINKAISGDLREKLA